MLIQCPECHKEISDKAVACIHCGYPIQLANRKNICIINGKEYDFNDIMEVLPKVGNKDTDVHPFYIVGMIRRSTPLDPKHAAKLAEIILENKSIPESYDGTIDLYAGMTQSVAKCPICQSTNLSKISSFSKATKIAAFGVFGMGDNGKTWKCNQCGSKF